MFIPLGDAPNDSHRTPWVNYGLIAVNVLVYLGAMFTHGGGVAYSRWVQSWGYVPLVPRPETLFTHMFMHAGFLHVAGNMLFLYVFGDNVERRLGHAGYLLFYLACGMAAVLMFQFLSPMSTIPLVGASGAIFGVEGFYFFAFPRNQVKVLIWILLVFVVWIPARVMLGLSFLLNLIQTFDAYGGTGTGGVAYAAHVGGFVAGLGMAATLHFTSTSRRRAPAGAEPGAVARALAEAHRLASARRYAAADHVLESALAAHAHDPRSPDLALLLGLMRSRALGRPEAARAPLEFAARLHPDPEARETAAAELKRIV